MTLEKVDKADAIEYWGHYPIADLEFVTRSPVATGLRAWTPFIPGDVAVSNTPGAVFEVSLRNRSDSVQSGAVAFSFPGFDSHKSTFFDKPHPVLRPPDMPNLPRRKIVRRPLENGLVGAWVTDENWKMSYVLAVMDGESTRIGRELAADGTKWSEIRNRLPEAGAAESGTSLVVDFKLPPGAAKTIRFVLAWYAPEWRGNGLPETGGNTYSHIYAKRYADAPAALYATGR